MFFSSALNLISYPFYSFSRTDPGEWVEEGPDKKPIQPNLYEYITKPVYSGSFSEPALSSYSTIEELPRAISRYKHFGPLSPYLLVIRCTYSNRHGMTVSGLYIMTMRKVSGCIRCLHDLMTMNVVK